MRRKKCRQPSVPLPLCSLHGGSLTVLCGFLLRDPGDDPQIGTAQVRIRASKFSHEELSLPCQHVQRLLEIVGAGRLVDAVAELIGKHRPALTAFERLRYALNCTISQHRRGSVLYCHNRHVFTNFSPLNDAVCWKDRRVERNLYDF